MVRQALVAFVGVLAMQTNTPQCGGTSTGGTAGGSTPTPNVVPISVNGGPTGNYFDAAFTTVTICVPGQSQCQTIGGILVDTGSSGLRVLDSALTLSLPQQVEASGAATVECNQFVDGFTWGPVQKADVKMAGEVASSIPIQVIGSASFPTVPASCSTNGPSENTLADLGANGVLGVGPFREDCGSACAFTGASNPGFYYACTGRTCQTTAEPLATQLLNPVWKFATDNNGAVLQFPAVPIGGMASLLGILTFGIGTQTDNALGSAQIFTAAGDGTFTTVFNGRSYPGSFIDSGSNGVFFLNTATTGIRECADAAGFYCPPVLLNLSATQRGVNGVTSAIAFSVGNLDTLNGAFNAFSEIGGTNPGSFDWGLPFFFGRTVSTAIEGQQTPGGVGPYFAF